VAVLGYLAGAGLAVVQHRLGIVSDIVLGVLVAAALVMYVRSHVRRRQSRL
jgi:membrane protein DedA with SNARE-associated domain